MDDRERYLAAAHAMQAGVEMKMNYDGGETTPKHLRVGINSAMTEHGALVKILVEKGIITNAEYWKAMADMMEEEKARYTKWLEEHLGVTVTLI